MKNPDPQFPDRPQHPDFWMISEIARENDEVWAERSEERIAQFVDFESLRYAVWNRAGFGAEEIVERLSEMEDLDLRAVIASSIMDGFIIGAAYSAKKNGMVAHHPVTTDGERRRP